MNSFKRILSFLIVALLASCADFYLDKMSTYQFYKYNGELVCAKSSIVSGNELYIIKNKKVRIQKNLYNGVDFLSIDTIIDDTIYINLYGIEKKSISNINELAEGNLSFDYNIEYKKAKYPASNQKKISFNKCKLYNSFVIFDLGVDSSMFSLPLNKIVFSESELNVIGDNIKMTPKNKKTLRRFIEEITDCN